MNKKKGFTLVELIVTIALLGLIGSIIAVNMVGLYKKQDQSETARIESIIKSAAETYLEVEQKSGCVSVEELIKQNYLKEKEIKDYKDKYVEIVNGELTIKSDQECNSDTKYLKVTYKSNLKDEKVQNMPTDNTKYKKGDYVTLNQAVPTTNGYNFVGWSKKENGNILTDSNTKITKNLNLYAIWTKKNFNVTYDLNGGTSPNINTASVAYKDSYTITSEEPVKAGYVFKGWRQNDNYSSNETDINYKPNDKITVTKNIILKAIYEPGVYTITLDNQNANVAGSKSLVEYYNSRICTDKNICNTSQVTIERPSKTGYKFKGYYTKKNGLGEQLIDENGKTKFINTAMTSNTTLYAYYEINKYNVIINEIYDTTIPTTQTIEYNNSLTKQISPKEGYEYSSISCNGTSTYSYKNNVLTINNIKSNVICNIKYIQNDYIVKLNINNGKISSLYNLILDNDYINVDAIENEHYPEPKVSNYGYKSTTISVEQFVQEKGLTDGAKIYSYQLNSNSGSLTGSIYVNQEKAQFNVQIRGSNFSFSYFKNGKITCTASNYYCKKEMNHSYFIPQKDLQSPIRTMYKLNFNTDKKEVVDVDKYEVISNISEDSGLYKNTKENRYFYRGKIDNNYISFAGKLWKILGINSDGSIRLISDFNIGHVKYLNQDTRVKKFDRKYLGYTYDNNKICSVTDPCSGNVGTNSNIKNYLESWYNNNLKQYDNYISYSYFDNLTTPHYFKYDNYYYSEGYIWDRSKSATYMNLYNLDSSFNLTYGGRYKSKIGIMTASEISDAGFLNGDTDLVNNKYPLDDNFLRTNYEWWTMSPSKSTEISGTYNITVNSSGINQQLLNSDNIYIRPVISLTSDAKVTGKGTKSNPYKIVSLNSSDTTKSFTIKKGSTLTYENPIVANQNYKFKNISCSNNQSNNASYNYNTHTFKITPTSNTVCNINFVEPIIYKIKFMYPGNANNINKISFPTITLNSSYKDQKGYVIKDNDKKSWYTHNIIVKVTDPNNFNFKVKINKYPSQVKFLSNNIVHSCENILNVIGDDSFKFTNFSQIQNNAACLINLPPQSTSTNPGETEDGGSDSGSDSGSDCRFDDDGDWIDGSC